MEDFLDTREEAQGIKLKMNRTVTESLQRRNQQMCVF